MVQTYIKNHFFIRLPIKIEPPTVLSIIKVLKGMIVSLFKKFIFYEKVNGLDVHKDSIFMWILDE